jgi:hypothetical protein
MQHCLVTVHVARKKVKVAILRKKKRLIIIIKFNYFEDFSHFSGDTLRSCKGGDTLKRLYEKSSLLYLSEHLGREIDVFFLRPPV